MFPPKNPPKWYIALYILWILMALARKKLLNHMLSAIPARWQQVLPRAAVHLDTGAMQQVVQNAEGPPVVAAEAAEPHSCQFIIRVFSCDIKMILM